jgi:hypothetical protein
MPQVTIPTPNGRTGVEHLAQMTFYVKWGEEVINATEETELLHPDLDVGRVVSLPGKGD